MELRKIAFGAIAGFLMTGAAASAADLPSRAPPPVFVPPAPIFTWTGFYIGGYGGGHFSETRVTSFDDPSFRSKKSGFVAGGLAGYNYQLSRVVIGIEGDAGFTDFKKSGVHFDGDSEDESADPFRSDASFVGRVRGRVGFAAGSYGFGETLLYVAGGGSFLRHRLTLTDDGELARISKDRIGFNIGGGVEVAVTNNWILRGEYIYDDYGSEKYAFSGVSGTSEFSDRKVKITDSTARAALEYKF